MEHQAPPQKTVDFIQPSLVAQPRQPCSPRFKLLARRWALPPAAQRCPQASALGALQARALPGAPRMACLTPSTKQNLAPPRKTVDFIQPHGGCEARTDLQPSLQAARMSKGTAPGSAVPTSAAASFAGTSAHCPCQCMATTNSKSTLSALQTRSKQISWMVAGLPAFTANMGSTGSLAPWIPCSLHWTNMVVRTRIRRAIAMGPQGDTYLAQDLLLAICHHIAKHDLSNEAVRATASA